MSRLARAFFTLGLVASSSLIAFAGSASAGTPGPTPLENSLTIVKTIDGPVAAGTTFTVSVSCDNDVIDDGDGGTDHVTVGFNAEGQPTTQSVFELLIGEYGSCTVTETQKGGAASTTYACEGGSVTTNSAPAATAVVPVCPEEGPIADPITVNKSFPAIEATVTVHNTFVAPPPAIGPQFTAAPVPVAAAPAFTG